ncbi:hypothetical protein HK405_010088, partial [Cladochytrium tenue]
MPIIDDQIQFLTSTKYNLFKEQLERKRMESIVNMYLNMHLMDSEAQLTNDVFLSTVTEQHVGLVATANISKGAIIKNLQGQVCNISRLSIQEEVLSEMFRLMELEVEGEHVMRRSILNATVQVEALDATLVVLMAVFGLMDESFGESLATDGVMAKKFYQQATGGSQGIYRTRRAIQIARQLATTIQRLSVVTDSPFEGLLPAIQQVGERLLSGLLTEAATGLGLQTRSALSLSFILEVTSSTLDDLIPI